MEYEIKYEHFLKFLIGGEADFIITNLKTGNHINFIFVHPKDTEKKKYNDNLYYIYYMSNKKIYLGAIHIFIDKGLVDSKISDKLNEDEIQKHYIFEHLIRYILWLKRYPKGVKITYTGKCSKCSRKLTDPKYIEIGIGKYCLENG